MSNTGSVIVIGLAVLVLLSVGHRAFLWKKRRRKCRPNYPEDCPKYPVAVGLIIGSVEIVDSNNNSIIILNGKIMAVSLLGAQQVIGNLVPVDINNNIIDLTQFPDVIQAGSVSAASSDQNVFNVVVDPANQLRLIVTSTGLVAGAVPLNYIARNVNNDLITGVDIVTVTLPDTTTTTSTSTSTTTTLENQIPLAVGFQLNWETATDL